jgi:hypothetical protein
VKHRLPPARSQSALAALAAVAARSMAIPALTLVAAIVALIVPSIASIGCAKVTAVNNNGTGGGGGRGNAGTGGSFVPTVGMCTGQCTDFPAEPVIDTNSSPAVPANPGSMFSGTPPASGGPCVVEPEDDTLFPNNWLRPRVKFTGAGGKLVQITMKAPNQSQTLTAYTMNDHWELPKAIWGALRFHQITDKVTVTVWVQGGGASQVTFRTAPVPAGGNLIFWAANPTTVDIDAHMCQPPNPIDKCATGTKLLGFSVGDESTIPVLQIPQVKQPSKVDSGNPAPVTCIGCHSGMPDSGFVTFVDSYPWRAATASVQSAATQGNIFTTQTPGGLAALQIPGWGPFTYNKMTWAPGMRIGIAALGLATPTTIDYSNGPDRNPTPSLAWINLESPNPGTMMGQWIVPSYAPGMGITSGNAVGIIARTGDPAGVAFPNWSHNGQTILYASTVGGLSGRLATGRTDLYTVPFNGGLGGTATPVAGAADSTTEEYYPAYSPDDKLIAYTRVPSGSVMYGNPSAELAVIPAAGGTPTRLRANSPPACTGKTSPGINNHWPKWSPEFMAGSEGTYYWIIFSSNRADLPPGRSTMTNRSIPISQLYMAPVIQSEFEIFSYPAIYLWNQPTDSVNTTPAWETFTIPPIE